MTSFVIAATKIGYCMSGHAIAHSERGQSGYLKEGAVRLDKLLHNKGYCLHPHRSGESYVKTGFHKHRYCLCKVRPWYI